MLVAAFLGLAACSSSRASTEPAEHIVLTGASAGTVSGIRTDCSFNLRQANFHLQGSLGSSAVDLNIQVNGYAGPKTYPVGSLLDGAGEVRLQVGSSNFDSTTGAGTVTVNSGEHSGTVTVDLLGGEHVEGTFSCDSMTTA